MPQLALVEACGFLLDNHFFLPTCRHVCGFVKVFVQQRREARPTALEDEVLVYISHGKIIPLCY